MEGANEAARRAVNGLLDAAGFEGPRCGLWRLQEPEVLAPWRLHDAARYERGLPWDDSSTQVVAHVLRGASPLLDQVSALLPLVQHFAAGPADASASPGVAGAETGLDGVAGPAGFVERLDWYRALLTDTLDSAVPAGEPQKHLYALVRDFVDRAGKGLRPALCLATAAALGGRREDAFPAAAGIEMLHNAFLVHDDIEDGSDSRRGAPTMHRRAGVPIAINAGDAMNALAMRLLRRSGERLGPLAALRILDEVDHMLVESLEGQAIELGWMRDNDLALVVDDYLRLVLKKTAWYSFIHPLRIGAIVADENDDDLDRFDRFGYLLGLAFQLTDDVLNLRGSAARYGKEIDGDLWEGKRTMIIAHALAHADRTDRAWMGDFLARSRDRRLPREVFRLHDILERGGSIEWARQSAAAFAEAAARELDEVAFAGVPPGPDLDWLRSCIPFLVSREG
jgi:geranylgeranyl pyrophosphate synthase